MATTSGAWAQVTHGQFEADKVLSPGDTYRVLSFLNDYNEQEDAAARELLARVLKFRKKKHNVREVGGTTDPLALEHQPASTSTPNPQGPATQGQFSSNNEEALLKCLENAERTEFSTENRPPPSTSEANREIRHGPEGTEQTANEEHHREPNKAVTSPQQSDQDMAKTEAN